MSEKVKVSREVANAIESALELYRNHPRKSPVNGVLEHTINGTWAEERVILHEIEPIELAKILINGYEVEETKEEKASKYFKQMCPEFTYVNGCVKDILNILEIEIKGINK